MDGAKEGWRGIVVQSMATRVASIALAVVAVVWLQQQWLCQCDWWLIYQCGWWLRNWCQLHQQLVQLLSGFCDNGSIIISGDNQNQNKNKKKNKNKN